MAGILDVFGGGKAFGMSWDAKKVYGSKPVIPELPTLESAQKTAVGANAANFADIAKLATGVNTFNQDQLNALIDRTLGPGVRQSIQDNLAAQARGEIPRDVQDAIYRGTAERSAGGNAFGGGGFSRNITARDLGLTSLDITNKALSSAESWLASAKAPTFDVTSMFITPMQQSAANTDQFNRNLLAAKTVAAPDPVERGQFDSSMALTGMVLGIYSGGAGYQGTYKPDTSSPGAGGGGNANNSFYLPQNFGGAYNQGGGLAQASYDAGVNNPSSVGGYNYKSGGGGLSAFF